jgi:hypothetical protein
MSVQLILTAKEVVVLATLMEDHAQLEPEVILVQQINQKLQRLLGLPKEER